MAAIPAVPAARARAATVRRVHLVVGLSGVLAFVGTGVFMKLQFPALYEANEAVRFTMRANHIYLLMASLINLLLAAYLQFETGGWRRRLAEFGSGAILLAPFVLWAAFLVEGPTGSPARLLTFGGVALLLAGAGAHLANRKRAG